MDAFVMYREDRSTVYRRCNACQKAYITILVESAKKQNPWENI
jgi:PP-loop superfamily ATP-utilizing enzyme